MTAISPFSLKKTDCLLKNLESFNKNDSIWNRIQSAITYPFSWIINSIQNLLWRLADPNWHSFVDTSRGHFIYSSNRETFSEAVKKADSFFNLQMKQSSEKKEWHFLYKEKQQMSIEERWKEFKRAGTCYGNCRTLAFYILSAKRFLTISEMKKLESTTEFTETAQFIHLIQKTQKAMNQSIGSNGLKHLTQTTSFSEKLVKLGLTEKNYPEDKYSSFVNFLFQYGIESKEMKEILDDSSLSGKKLAPKVFELGDKNLQNHYCHEVSELNKQYNSSINEDRSFILEKDKRLDIDLDSIGSKGVILLDSFSTNSSGSGHSMLFEFDREQNLYILYDNNRGFYQWDNAEKCLKALEARLRDNKQDFCSITSFSIER